MEWSLWSLLQNMSDSQQEERMSEIFEVNTLNKLNEKKCTTLLTFVITIEGKGQVPGSGASKDRDISQI